MKRVFIDIETNYIGTALDKNEICRDYNNHDITILGLCIVKNSRKEFHQQVGPDINKENLLHLLEGTTELISYNGRSKPDALKGFIGFDFGVISAKLGIVLDDIYPHTDLCVECWRHKLYGGLKMIEIAIGIERILPEKNGIWAQDMWRMFNETGEEVYLELLLAYNKEDIMNLIKLETFLQERYCYKSSCPNSS
jgi:uncharacterized protein YprB with RNaseH-like and TPR domain